MYVAQLVLSIVSLVQLVSYIISILFVTGFVSFFSTRRRNLDVTPHRSCNCRNPTSTLNTWNFRDY